MNDDDILDLEIERAQASGCIECDDKGKIVPPAAILAQEIQAFTDGLGYEPQTDAEMGAVYRLAQLATMVDGLNRYREMRAS